MSERNDDDVLKVIATRGSRGLIDVLRKEGFVDQSTVDARIEARAQQLVTENQVQSDYPDLNNPSSGFFKEVAPRYRALLDQGVPKGTALKAAAQQVELDGYKSGKLLTPAQKEAAERSQTSSKKKATEEDEDLTDFQKTICDAMQISYEDYRKNAKRGNS